jgi:hypothetical protein
VFHGVSIYHHNFVADVPLLLPPFLQVYSYYKAIATAFTTVANTATIAITTAVAVAATSTTRISYKS